MTDLSITAEAFTEIRASANLDFFSRAISGFITGFPFRYMQLEWRFVDYLGGIRLALQGILTAAHFDFLGAANVQLTDSKKRRMAVWRRQSDVRPVTILASLISWADDHPCLRLSLFNSELLIDEQRSLCIDDELRQAVLNFL